MNMERNWLVSLLIFNRVNFLFWWGSGWLGNSVPQLDYTNMVYFPLAIAFVVISIYSRSIVVKLFAIVVMFAMMITAYYAGLTGQMDRLWLQNGLPGDTMLAFWLTLYLIHEIARGGDVASADQTAQTVKEQRRKLFRMLLAIAFILQLGVFNLVYAYRLDEPWWGYALMLLLSSGYTALCLLAIYGKYRWLKLAFIFISISLFAGSIHSLTFPELVSEEPLPSWWASLTLSWALLYCFLGFFLYLDLERLKLIPSAATSRSPAWISADSC